MTIEKANTIGFLDVEAAADGEPLSAHILREMARNTNYLIAQPQLILRLIYQKGLALDQPTGAFDPALDGYTNSLALFGMGNNKWIPLTAPCLVRKAPHHRTATVKIRLQVTDGSLFRVQVSSLVQPFNPAGLEASTTTSTQDNIYVGRATGDYELITLTVDLLPGVEERLFFCIQVFLDPAVDPLMDEAEYGAPNSDIAGISLDWENGGLGFSGSTWTSGLVYAGHYVTCYYVGLDTISLQPSQIIEAHNGGLHHQRIFADTGGVDPVTSRLFEIRKMPEYRIVSIAVYSDEMTAVGE